MQISFGPTIAVVDTKLEGSLLDLHDPRMALFHAFVDDLRKLFGIYQDKLAVLNKDATGQAKRLAEEARQEFESLLSLPVS